MPRKSDFKPEYVDQALKFCLLGAKDAELAVFFGVSEKTLANWKNAHPEFLQALKEGKEVSNAKVAASLYNRAIGYEWDEQVPTKVKRIIYNDDGKKLKEVETVVLTTVHKVMPPETTAAIFWLKNRRRDDWRDRQEVTGADGGPIETATITYMPKQLPDGYYNQPTPAAS